MQDHFYSEMGPCDQLPLHALYSPLLSWPLESYTREKPKSCLPRSKPVLPSPAHSGFTGQVIPISPHHVPMDLKANKQHHFLSQANMSLKVSPHIKGKTDCKHRKAYLSKKHGVSVRHSIYPRSLYLWAGRASRQDLADIASR